MQLVARINHDNFAMSACQLVVVVVAVAFVVAAVVVAVVVVAVSMQIQQTVTKCATLSALILDSDAHETRLSPAFHFIFHISFFSALALLFFIFPLSLFLTPFQLLPVRKISWPRFPHGTPCESFSQRRQRGETKASHMQHPFFPHLCVPPFALPFCTCLPSLLSLCVFFCIFHTAAK